MGSDSFCVPPPEDSVEKVTDGKHWERHSGSLPGCAAVCDRGAPGNQVAARHELGCQDLEATRVHLPFLLATGGSEGLRGSPEPAAGEGWHSGLSPAVSAVNC